MCDIFGTQCGGSFGTRLMSWQLTFTQQPWPTLPIDREAVLHPGGALCRIWARLGSRIHGKVGMKKDGTGHGHFRGVV